MVLNSLPNFKIIFKISATILLFSDAFLATAQSVGISSTSITPHTSSILELRTTNKGFLPPRLTTSQRDAISSPATGLMIFNSTTNRINYFTGSTWKATADSADTTGYYTIINANTSGVGVSLPDSSHSFRFKGINAASGKLSVTDNTGSNTIDVDINQSNLSLNSMGDTLAAGKGGTGQTTYSNGQLLIGNSSGNLSKANLTAGSGIDITNGSGSVTISNNIPVTEAYSLTDATTSSTSYVSVGSGLTLTPGAGDYLIFFSGNVENPTKDESTYFAIFVNGSKMAQSERYVTGHVKGGENFSASTMAYITGLGSGQTIEVKWKVTSSSTAMHERQLIAQRIK
jgi:hypothetical protein